MPASVSLEQLSPEIVADLRNAARRSPTAGGNVVLGSPVAAAGAAANDIQLGIEMRRQGLAYSPSNFAAGARSPLPRGGAP